MAIVDTPCCYDAPRSETSTLNLRTSEYGPTEGNLSRSFIVFVRNQDDHLILDEPVYTLFPTRQIDNESETTVS